jgi:hypothetical protein
LQQPADAESDGQSCGCCEAPAHFATA